MLIKAIKIFAFLILIIPTGVFAQSDNPSPLTLPVPKNIDNLLFYLQRDPNTNTIIYALNKDKDGNLDKSEPINAYWIRYTESGKRKDLGYIQRKFAYGVAIKNHDNNQFEFQFVAYKKLSLYLIKSDTDQKYHAYVSLKGKKIQLERIFVRIEGGSFWLPNVKYVEIKGLDTATGKNLTERINLK